MRAVNCFIRSSASGLRLEPFSCADSFPGSVAGAFSDSAVCFGASEDAGASVFGCSISLPAFQACLVSAVSTSLGMADGAAPSVFTSSGIWFSLLCGFALTLGQRKLGRYVQKPERLLRRDGLRSLRLWESAMTGSGKWPDREFQPDIQLCEP